MTVAGKINALVIAIAATAGCLLTAHTIQSEYRLSLDRIIEQLEAEADARLEERRP